MNKPTKHTEKPIKPAKTVIYYDGSFNAARKRFEDLYND